MNNSQLAHVWAQGMKKSGKGSNMFFEGDTIYSYGHHFPIATMYQFSRDYSGGTILFNSNGYSITTAKHKSQVRNAIDRTKWEVIEVPNPLPGQDHANNIEFLKNKAIETRALALKAIRYAYSYASELEGVLRSLRVYCKWANQKLPKGLPKEFTPDECAVFLAKKESFNKKVNAKDEADYQAWSFDFSIKKVWHSKPVKLRLKNGHVETSRGACAPLDDVMSAFTQLENGTLEAGTVIGNFTIDSVNESDIKIGCHSIDLTEIRAVLGKISV